MTSIDSARFRSYETTPRTAAARLAYVPQTDDTVSLVRRGALFSKLDKIGLSLATVMALGPLGMTALGSFIYGA